MDHVLALPWKQLLQRLPGVWLFAVALLALFGAAHLPYVFSFYFVLLHILSLNAAWRVAYGSYHAKRMAALTSFRDWRGDMRRAGVEDEFQHVIILPNYRENMDTLCETLDILASHSGALSTYKVCLAMEQGEQNAESKAMTLVSRYIDHFLQIVYTIHPKGIPGETAGKHSNVSWAVRQMTRKTKDNKHHIVTVMDADTAFAEDYFNAVAYHYAASLQKEGEDVAMQQIFAPSTVFDRNAYDVPAFVRLSDMIWSAGVMGNYVPFSPITIPCSAYSLPMSLVSAVDFWDVGSEGLGEDMHMFLKCFFATEGRLKVTPIFSPASCCNIEGKEGSGTIGFMRARYGQAKRHLWGCLDFGYTLHRTLTGIIAPGYAGAIVGREHRRIDTTGKDKLANPTAALSEEIHLKLYKVLVLIHRLSEAHIVGGHMFLMIVLTGLLVPVGPEPSQLSIDFWQAITSEAVHPIVIAATELCGWIRLLSLSSVVLCAYNYEQYHTWVASTRWRLSAAGETQPFTNEFTQYVNGISVGVGKKVQHLGRRPELQCERGRWYNYLDWFAIPVTGLLYQAIPQIHAQVLQLYTDRIDYEVAAKPSLKSHPAAHPVPEEPGIIHVYGGHERLPGEVVGIPALAMDEVETLVSPSEEHSPDEILVLQGLKAHRFDMSKRPSTETLHIPPGPAGARHSHTSSYSSEVPGGISASATTADQSMRSTPPPSFPTSPRMNFTQPPPPYVQSQSVQTGSSNNSPLLNPYSQPPHAPPVRSSSQNTLYYEVMKPPSPAIIAAPHQPPLSTTVNMVAAEDMLAEKGVEFPSNWGSYVPVDEIVVRR